MDACNDLKILPFCLGGPIALGGSIYRAVGLFRELKSCRLDYEAFKEYMAQDAFHIYSTQRSPVHVHNFTAPDEMLPDLSPELFVAKSVALMKLMLLLILLIGVYHIYIRDAWSKAKILHADKLRAKEAQTTSSGPIVVFDPASAFATSNVSTVCDTDMAQPDDTNTPTISHDRLSTTFSNPAAESLKLPRQNPTESSTTTSLSTEMDDEDPSSLPASALTLNSSGEPPQDNTNTAPYGDGVPKDEFAEDPPSTASKTSATETSGEPATPCDDTVQPGDILEDEPSTPTSIGDSAPTGDEVPSSTNPEENPQGTRRRRERGGKRNRKRPKEPEESGVEPEDGKDGPGDAGDKPEEGGGEPGAAGGQPAQGAAGTSDPKQGGGGQAEGGPKKRPTRRGGQRARDKRQRAKEAQEAQAAGAPVGQ